jgi:hypothetical protein
MKILVSIATYDDKNFTYLNRIIDEYKTYKKYDLTINVHGTVPLPRSDINFISHVNPPNTVFFHRQEFADERNNYDLFLFSEDDMLIKEEAVDTYVKYTSTLPVDYCLGFLRYETRPISVPDDKNLYLIDLWPDVSHRVLYRQMPDVFGLPGNIGGPSFITAAKVDINKNSYFVPRNSHQASSILTPDRLDYAMKNSDFLKVWEGANGGFEAGGSGIFKNWDHADGTINKVCIRNLEDLKKCLIHHIPNVHCDEPYKVGREFPQTVATLDSLVSYLVL